MKKLLKALLGLIAGIVVLAAGAGVFLRMQQGVWDPPRDVDGVDDVMWSANSGAYLYCATVGGGSLVAFDAGIDVKGGPVAAFAPKMGATRKLTHVFITHGHPDHIGALAVLPSEVATHGGAADASLMDKTRKNPKTVPQIVDLIFKTVPVKVSDPLEGRREIDVGDGEKVVAIPFPGHSPGSYLYFHRGVLYAGDSINHTKGKLTPGMDLFNEDTPGNHASIRTLPQLLEGLEIVTVCTGHGGCSLAGEAKRMIDELVASVGA